MWPRERANGKGLGFCQIRLDALVLENNKAQGECDGVPSCRTGKLMDDQWALHLTTGLFR